MPGSKERKNDVEMVHKSARYGIKCHGRRSLLVTARSARYARYGIKLDIQEEDLSVSYFSLLVHSVMKI